jgi:GNAT superfamily N-acetyltransferase
VRRSENFQIGEAASAADISAVRMLFEAYAASLPIDLAYQAFADELAGLPGKYAPPRGALLLARDEDETPLGCVALRPLAEGGCCEMKRLYLRPAARRRGLGRALAEAVIGAARRIGYDEIRLDTLTEMAQARRLYEQLGFKPIAPYYAPTPPGTVFLSLRLREA